jgi:3-hydroxy acid dehydrogenase/malonic semialdehyde reductase
LKKISDMPQTKQTCLITGASSGIGEALAREMITKGCLVIGIARSEDRLNALARELGENFIPYRCDVAQEKSIKNVSQELKEKNYAPTLFFLNAGIAGDDALEDPLKIELMHHHKVMAINYFGVLSWVHEWADPMSHHDTTFVVTSSVNAFFAPPGGAAYAASKAAIAKTFESLQLSYINTKVRFSIVYSGPVATKGLKGKVPFVWSAEKLAKYMVRQTLKGKQHIEPSLFYSIITRLFNVLPKRFVAHILKQLMR